jgi:hypothetical protein
MSLINEANDILNQLLQDNVPTERRFSKLIRDTLASSPVKPRGIWVFETRVTGFSFELDFNLEQTTLIELREVLANYFPHCDVLIDAEPDSRSVECILTNFIPDGQFWQERLEVVRKKAAIETWMLREIKECVNEGGFTSPIPL